MNRQGVFSGGVRLPSVRNLSTFGIRRKKIDKPRKDCYNYSIKGFDGEAVFKERKPESCRVVRGSGAGGELVPEHPVEAGGSPPIQGK